MIKVAYDLNNFIVLAARMPQIWKNYQVKSRQQVGNVSPSCNDVYMSIVGGVY